MDNSKINFRICYTNCHVNRTYNSTNTIEKKYGCEHDACLTRLQEDDGGKEFTVPMFTVMRTYKPSTRSHRPSPTL